MSTALPSLGFAGIGLMGLPMCRRLLAAGYPLTVWNRSSDKCAPLVAAGARQARSPAELCAATDVVTSSNGSNRARRIGIPGSGTERQCRRRALPGERGRASCPAGPTQHTEQDMTDATGTRRIKRSKTTALLLMGTAP